MSSLGIAFPMFNHFSPTSGGLNSTSDGRGLLWQRRQVPVVSGYLISNHVELVVRWKPQQIDEVGDDSGRISSANMATMVCS